MGRTGKKAQLLLYVPPEVQKALKAKSAATGRSMSEIVSEMLAREDLSVPATQKPEINKKAIEKFCRKHKVKTFSLFGSILRDDFGPNSDVDVLFEPARGKRFSFFEHSDMQEELEKLFARPVDLINKKVFMKHRNEIRKKSILESAQVVVSL